MYVYMYVYMYMYDTNICSSMQLQASLPKRDGVRQGLRVGPWGPEEASTSDCQQLVSFSLLSWLGRLGGGLVESGANNVGALLAGEVATSTEAISAVLPARRNPWTGRHRGTLTRPPLKPEITGGTPSCTETSW